MKIVTSALLILDVIQLFVQEPFTTGISPDNTWERGKSPNGDSEHKGPQISAPVLECNFQTELITQKCSPGTAGSQPVAKFQVLVAPGVRAIFGSVARHSPTKVTVQVCVSSLWGSLCCFVSHFYQMDTTHLSQNTCNEVVQLGYARGSLCSQQQRSEGTG